MLLQGLLKVIGEEKKISEKFTVREFVVTLADSQYPQYITLQLSNDKVDLIDPYKVGEEIKVEFNIRGREWKNATSGEVKYFNTLQAWKIERVNPVQEEPQSTDPGESDQPYNTPPDTSNNDDLPF